MAQTLVKPGIKVSGLAHQITTEDLELFDIILTMDDQNSSNVNKLQKFTNFYKNYSETEPPDLYYGDKSALTSLLIY